jgi:endoglucanase
MAQARRQLSSFLFLALTACAASNPGSPTGGKATGGVLSSGGAGGAMSTGGVIADGGNTGGVVDTGGSARTGGSTTAAGGTGSGGATATGGSTATGGVRATGGAGATGGILATGGRMGTGGARTGGTNATGGAATGGQSDTSTRATGGSATGGSATGGSAATGGSTSLGLTAAQAAAAMGKGVNIGQTFESTQNERTLAAVSAKIDAYYAKGFRNVRIPITWTEPVGGDRLVGSATVGDVNRSHARLAVIKQVVDYALGKPDLYVIINAHHETGLKTNSRTAVLERLWADIADIFAAKEHRLLFELLNEPHRSDGSNSPLPAEDLRAMVKLAYAKIRAVDPARIVLIGGNQWFAAAETASVWSDLAGVGDGQDPYLMATFHHYDPWTFCGDNQGTYDDNWTDTNVSGPMDTMLTWARSTGKGMPVYIGEWGVGWGSRYSTMDCNNIRSWYQRMAENAQAKGIPTSLWDDNGWFKVWDIGAKSWNNNLADCIASTCAWNGTDRFNAGCK